jgi:hypothetical protein
MGIAGRQRGRDEYLWENKGTGLDTMFPSVLGRRRVAAASSQ